jgi:hypothetical protein
MLRDVSKLSPMGLFSISIIPYTTNARNHQTTPHSFSCFSVAELNAKQGASMGPKHQYMETRIKKFTISDHQNISDGSDELIERTEEIERIYGIQRQPPSV